MVGNYRKVLSRRVIKMVPLFSYCFLIVFTFTGENEKRYFLEPSITLEPDHTVSHLSPLSDPLSSDTLYEVRSQDDIPIYYYRKIKTNVCFDNKCRLLRANVYWNITGRYLGLGFTEDEFLSKTDHVPFSESEYQEMNQLLSDSLSLLSDYHFEDVVVLDSVQDTEVDGITSATLPAIKDYVVEGAAYTTLKLWHIIHGPNKTIIEKLTVHNLTEALSLLLLDSGNSYDVVWTVHELCKKEKLSNHVQTAIADNLGENYSLTNSILNTLNSRHVDSNFQSLLLQVFHKSDYGIKVLVADKLADVEYVDGRIALEMVKVMESIQGGLFVGLLEFLGQHHWQDMEIYRYLSELLKLPNVFLSGKVYDFLKAQNLNDPVITRAMEQYEINKTYPAKD